MRFIPVEIKQAISNIVDRIDLSAEEMRAVMQQIMTGGATPIQIGGILAGLRTKGETVEEIVAAARVMRELALRIYDLSGRQVRALRKETIVLGLFGEGPGDPAWDGRDDSGEKVPPGVYLYRLTLETDEGAREKAGTIVVAY